MSFEADIELLRRVLDLGDTAIRQESDYALAALDRLAAEHAAAERVIALSWVFAKAGTPDTDHKAQLRAALRDLAAPKETAA